MKYFWTLFWTFILVQMVMYVGSSMLGTAFDFNMGLILTVVVTILLLVISAIIPEEPASHEGSH